MPIISKKSDGEKKPGKWLIIFCLVVAGETIFGLPFHVIRYFRPTLLEVFNLTNTQIGDAIAIYGVTAMICYFPSGVIADRFSARKLMTLSLVATALGGVAMVTIPNQFGLALIYGFWGITTILLFWSAMLRTTREWGGKQAQGRAFGFLDGGRGLVGAVAATGAVFFLASLLPSDMENISTNQRTQALKAVIWFYTLLTLGSAVLIWIFIPERKMKKSKSNTFKGIAEVLKSRSAWLQATIVICAYCGYRGLDFYTMYGVDVLGMNEVSAARFMSIATYLRPVGAIAAGFLADRFTTKKVIVFTFMMLVLSYMVTLLVAPLQKFTVIIFANLIVTILVVYALRGVYFALFEETHVPKRLTGTTVGLVSLVGFTPDIFFNSVAGRFIDAAPGIAGYQNFYLFLIVFASVGIIATLLLNVKRKDRSEQVKINSSI
jgi:sugar phosphate permease